MNAFSSVSFFLDLQKYMDANARGVRGAVREQPCNKAVGVLWENSWCKKTFEFLSGF